MRRFSTIAAVALAGSLALAGCGSNSSGGGGSEGDGSASGEVDVCETADGDGPKIGMAYDVGGRGDQSFNDSAYAGLERAVEEIDATCIEANAQTDDNDTTRADRLRTLAEGDYNPVVAVGYLYSNAAATVAKEYPDTDFAVVDGYSTTDDAGGAGLENLADLTFAENEGSYLVGVAAALTTESDQIGFVGGIDGNLIQKFEAGYVAGAKSINPDIQIDVQYLTQDQNDAATGYENPSGGRAAAEAMYQGGADVVYHAAGKSGLGVFQAATAAGDGNWAIGVDSDQYLTAADDQKPRILTSMLKRIDTAVFEAASAVADEDWQNGFVTYDLAAEGVGYSTSGGFVDGIEEQINAAGEQIISGEVEVPETPAD